MTEDYNKIYYTLIAHNKPGILLAKEQDMGDIQRCIEIPEDALPELRRGNYRENYGYDVMSVIADFMKEVEKGTKDEEILSQKDQR